MTPDEDYARRLTFFQGQRERLERHRQEAEAALAKCPLWLRVAARVIASIHVALYWAFGPKIWKLRIDSMEAKWRIWKLERQIKRNERKLCTHKQPTS